MSLWLTAIVALQAITCEPLALQVECEDAMGSIAL